MQELAINSLVNISLAEKAERSILAQGAIGPVVGLLSSDVPKLQQQAAMLLSNLLTNKDIRENVRYLGWVDAIIAILKTGEVAVVQQILRVVINITFDAHCRHLLSLAEAEKYVAQVAKRIPDPQVSQLTTTALKNLTVPAPSDVQSEVEQARSSGKFRNVAAPQANRRDAKNNDLEGLDDLIGNISGSRPVQSSASSGARAPQPVRSAGRDDLDDLLGDLNTPSKPAAKPAPAPAIKPIQQPAAAKPAPARYPSKPVDNDLDDLLSEVSAPRPQAPAQSLSDIDDLLADIDTPKKPVISSAKATPAPRPAPAPAPAPPKPAGKQAPKNSSVDDIDDLLADIGSSGPPARAPAASASRPPPPPPAGKKQDLDDIDDLLDGISISGNDDNKQSSNTGDIDDLLADIDAPPRGGRPQSTYNATASTDDIDDLLDGLGGGGGRNDPGMAAIDDLLADLNG